MIGTEEKKAVKIFVEKWLDRGYEKGDTQQFWLQLLGAIGYEHKDTVLFEHHLNSGGYIDVWLRESNVMIEQKSLGVDLDKPELRQGKLKTPFKQVLDYAEDVPLAMQPSFLVTCNFETFRVYDRNKYDKSVLEQNAFEFSLKDLLNRPDYLNFILDPANSRLEKETAVSKQAGLLIGQLYDKLRKGYLNPDSPKAMHDLNVLCVRLVFCLYCEDAGLFIKDSFLNYLKGVAPEDVRLKLKNLFRALDTQKAERDPYDTGIKIFPYVNGGLFKEDIEIPNFTQETLDFLLTEVSAPVDWSQISPTIFGGIFESTLNPETRRSGGMHFTPVDDIHKVIDPLFLDDLWKEFRLIQDDENLTPIEKDARFREFHKYLCQLTFFDPACGSGNFLTETYLSLRKLEDAILGETLIKTKGKYGRNEYTEGAQMEMSGFHEEETGDRISLSQFYGIEINDFAVAVAETALWISRLKANTETLTLYSLKGNNFPLEEHANISLGNALRLDWNEIIPSDKCDYIMGNPPFVARAGRTARSDNGSKGMTSQEQKKDKERLFGKKCGDIDYVACWFKVASQYIKNTTCRCAFVATNSICQGQQLAPIWKSMFDDGIIINFAWQSFKWNSEGQKGATVYVVIVGFSRITVKPRLYTSDGERIEAKHINAYLKNDPDYFLFERSKPFSDVPVFGIGSQPIDNGNYLFSESEMIDFISKEPQAKPYFYKWMGADEFLKGKKRYVLWLGDASEKQIDSMPLCRERVKAVADYRSQSNRSQTKKAAKTPNHFGTEIISFSDSLIIPEVSSMKRLYLPIGFIDSSTLCSNKVRFAPNANLYHFGVLQSQFHSAWMRYVCGYYGPSYQYSVEVVYNNFVWPNPTNKQKAVVEDCAQAILTIRNKYSERTLASLYDPGNMPDELLAAHKALDAAVEAAYGVECYGDEEKIVAHLFKLHEDALREEQSLDSPQKADNKPKKTTVKVKIRIKNE